MQECRSPAPRGPPAHGGAASKDGSALRSADPPRECRRYRIDQLQPAGGMWKHCMKRLTSLRSVTPSPLMSALPAMNAAKKAAASAGVTEPSWLKSHGQVLQSTSLQAVPSPQYLPCWAPH